ncbi:metallophosphoesterase [Salimicrobium halophilum]|uniref:Predicted phosphohydrolase, MPP superfamily n=1 Tax=Salimicrobium halophilum TaxID=86666 RepID=A0A1G8PZ79_9BACI|nr:metallophosphoesterase [Salimicrobium halophilum]SDI97688.1 Predicted phosphohydrolase, MPP superfamily [Salimicrobium halophilum]
MRKFWITFLLVVGILRYMGKRAVTPVRREETIRLKHLKESFTVLFVSDVHNNRIEDRMTKEDVDIVVIGGDFVDKRVSDATMKHNLEALTKLNKPIFFIPGNNDREKETLFELLATYGVITLSNDTYTGETYSITGLDPYRPEGTTLPQKSNVRPSILIVHDPFFIHEWQDYAEDYDLVLAGHTHGGQVRFMGYGPYERGGWKKFGGKSVFVSEGYGTSLLPIRLETHSEYHVFTMQNES